MCTLLLYSTQHTCVHLSRTQLGPSHLISSVKQSIINPNIQTRVEKHDLRLQQRSAAPSLSGSTGPAAAAAAKTAPLIDEAPNLLLPGPRPPDRRAPAPASRTRLSRTAAGSNTYRREAPLWCYNKYLHPPPPKRVP